jgi:folate-binding protein YgfZ
MLFLLERAVISISGEDAAKFLQGIISNDINLAAKDNILYAMLLTPQGKLLYDIFVHVNTSAYEQSFLLDVPMAYKNEILKKLKIYKLRAKVEIRDVSDDYKVYAEFQGERGLPDPRDLKLGNRFVSDHEINEDLADINLYKKRCIDLLVADYSLGVVPESCFPLELDCNRLNAVSYTKGCYVGQEVTARTHHRGVVRKKLVKFSANENVEINSDIPINQGEKKIGKVVGFIADLGLGFALIKPDMVQEGEIVTIDFHQITLF